MSGRIVFFTGAGVSAESGIPTWRSGDDGVWKTEDPNRVCNINNYFKCHDEALAFYNQRQEIYSKCQPNAAHYAVAQLQREFPNDVYCITQNVDDLFERAGCVDVDHLHGSFDTMKCLNCGNEWDIEKTKIYTKSDYCPECKSNKVKPGIIMFGENAPKYTQLIDFCYNLNADDTVVVIGTSFDVIPYQWVAGKVKHGEPPFRILCNLEKNYSISTWVFDKVIYGKITEHIDEIVQIVKERKLKR